MRKAAALIAFACLMAGCQTAGTGIYTGRLAEDDPSIIRSPNATGTTHDERDQATTRAQSNRVDIPVYEFAQIGCLSRSEGAISLSYYDARLTRSAFENKRSTDFTERRIATSGALIAITIDEMRQGRVDTLYRGIDGGAFVLHRAGAQSTAVVTGDRTTYLDSRNFGTDSVRAEHGYEESKTAEKLRASMSNEGLNQLSGERIIGLTLWKYADRDSASDGVTITYTIVYYNTNSYDTGPTEITEPLPAKTEYIEKSTTLPKEGVTVELLKGSDGARTLRWVFPKGIKAGETNKMSYQVKVRLSSDYAGGGNTEPAPADTRR